MTSCAPFPEQLSFALLAYAGHTGPPTDAALVGVAPFNRERRTAGQTHRLGWPRPDPCRPVYGSVGGQPLHPVIRDFYQRLLAAGKPKKLALTACMRKLLIILNSMLKHRFLARSDSDGLST